VIVAVTVLLGEGLGVVVGGSVGVIVAVTVLLGEGLSVAVRLGEGLGVDVLMGAAVGVPEVCSAVMHPASSKMPMHGRAGHRRDRKRASAGIEA